MDTSARRWKILEKQIRARAKTAAIAHFQETAAAAKPPARSHQQAKSKATRSPWLISDTDKEERATIAHPNQLAFPNDMPKPSGSDDSKSIRHQRAEPIADLTATQDRIADTLPTPRRHRARRATLAEMKNRPGGDLPDDTRKKLEEARISSTSSSKRRRRSSRLGVWPETGRDFSERIVAQDVGASSRPLAVHEGTQRSASAGSDFSTLDGQGTQRDPDRAENGRRC